MEKLNLCTIISKEVMTTLREWVLEMKGSFEELNLKKAVSIKSEEMIKVQ
jgi:hypothetical protein